MPHLNRQGLALCACIVLIGTFISACDSTTAPERGVKGARVEALPPPCDPQSQQPCPDEPVHCSVASGVLASCIPMEPQCLDPATGEPYPCPLPVERIVF